MATNWPQIPDHSYRILNIENSGLGKTNSLLNLIIYNLYTDKIHLYSMELHEAKYQFLDKKRKGADLKHRYGSKAVIRYSNDMDDIYEKMEE